jgi:hypothetical protein
MAAWLRSTEDLTGPGARTGAADGVIAGGMVIKAGPAAEAEAAAVTKQAKTASVLTAYVNPRPDFLQTRHLLEAGWEVAKNEGGQAQEKEEADHVGDGRQHNSGSKGRVDAKGLQSQWNQHPRYTCCDHIQDHCGEGDHTESDLIFPQPRHSSDDQTNCHAVEESHDDFLPKNGAVMLFWNFP